MSTPETHQPHRFTCTVLAVLAVLGLAVVALPACGHSYSRTASDDDDSARASVGTGSSDLRVIRARTVVLDPPTGVQREPQVLGYLEEKVNPEGDHFYFVFDGNYNRRLGYYTDNGATYRYDYHGQESLIGNYVPEKSLHILYGAGEGAIRLVRE